MQLFSFNGRIRRRDYWLYNFGLGVMGTAINIFTLESGFELALVIFIAILFSWIGYIMLQEQKDATIVGIVDGGR